MISRQHRFSPCIIVSVLLGVWTEVTRGEISIQMTPQHPVIGESVTFTVTGINGELLYLIWYKGQGTNPENLILTYFPSDDKTISGALFHDRITVLLTGNLKISNLNRTDEGNYLAKIQPIGSQEVDIHVNLKISEKVVKPTVTANTSRPKENDIVIFTCSSANADRILWSKNNASLPPGANLSSNDMTLTLHNITRTDSGKYQCKIENLVSFNFSDPYELQVSYGPENVVVNSQRQGNRITLECVAVSDPPPTYRWRFNGTDLDDESNPLIVDITMPKNAGNYECVVNNTVTHQTANNSIYIDSDKVPESPGNLETIIGCVVAVLLLMALVAALVYFFVIHRRHKKQKADSLSKSTKGGNSRNGQANARAPVEGPPEIQYADIVIKNMPRKVQTPPEAVYANRVLPANPPQEAVVYSELRIN